MCFYIRFVTDAVNDFCNITFWGVSALSAMVTLHVIFLFMLLFLYLLIIYITFLLALNEVHSQTVFWDAPYRQYIAQCFAHRAVIKGKNIIYIYIYIHINLYIFILYVIA